MKTSTCDVLYVQNNQTNSGNTCMSSSGYSIGWQLITGNNYCSTLGTSFHATGKLCTKLIVYVV